MLFTIRWFYESNNAVVQTTEAGKLIFTRGKRWISLLSPLLALSERWPAQTITVSVRQEGGTSFADISYDVRIFLTLIAAPNQLVKEIQKLRSLLAEATPMQKAA
jgi:hypothetical protein